MNCVIGPTWPRIIKKEFQTHDKKSRLARNIVLDQLNSTQIKTKK